MEMEAMDCDMSPSGGPEAVTLMDLISDSSFDSSKKSDVSEVRKNFGHIFEKLSGQKADLKSLKTEANFFSITLKRFKSKKKGWEDFKSLNQSKFESRVLQPALQVL